MRYLPCLFGAAAARPNFLIFQPDDMPFFDVWDEAPPSSDDKNYDYDDDEVTNNYDDDVVLGLPDFHINRLRAESAVFTRAYVVATTCSPSRLSTLTGRYASRSAWGNREGKYGDCSVAEVWVPTAKFYGGDLESNMATKLGSAGYATAVAGKWHLNRKSEYGDGSDVYLEGGVEAAYARQIEGAKEAGFADAKGFYVSNVDYDGLPFSHNVEWVVSEAAAFVEENVDNDWFLYYNPTVPHSPGAADALVNFTVRDTPAGVLDEDPALEYPVDRQHILDITEELEGQRLLIRDDMRGCFWMDDAWASLRATLERLDVYDDTVILFMMDHGMEAKGQIYEAGARTAFFVRHPATFEAGARIDRLVANVDIAPTFYDLAGLPAADDVDGRSLLLDDPRDDRLIFVENNKDRAVVSRDFKLIKRYETDVEGCEGNDAECDEYYTACGAEEQLYFDLSKGERTNAVGNPGFRDTLADLRAALECHVEKTAVGDATLAQPDFTTLCHREIAASAATRSPTAHPTGVQGKQCALDGSDYEYRERVEGEARLISTNHCPNHVYSEGLNPNVAILEESAYEYPAFPRYDPSNLSDLSEKGGSVGTLFNGAMLYSGYGGDRYGKMVDYDSSATKHEGDSFDECGCHANSNTVASYHCHVPPSCLLRQLGQRDDLCGIPTDSRYLQLECSGTNFWELSL